MTYIDTRPQGAALIESTWQELVIHLARLAPEAIAGWTRAPRACLLAAFFRGRHPGRSFGVSRIYCECGDGLPDPFRVRGVLRVELLGWQIVVVERFDALGTRDVPGGIPGCRPVTAGRALALMEEIFGAAAVADVLAAERLAEDAPFLPATADARELVMA